MTVKKVWTVTDEYVITGSGYSSVGEVLKDGKPVVPQSQLIEILRYGAMCTSAEIDQAEKPVGDPTDLSILFAAKKVGISKQKELDEKPLLAEFLFDSNLKRMTTVHSYKDEYLVCTKGAVEVLLSLCKWVYIKGKVRKIDSKVKKLILSKMEEYAKNSYRVIGVAYRFVKPKSKELDRKQLESEMVFLGMLALYDPPRDEVYEAIKQCKQAGIDVKMLTGDYKKTALAIAREIGLINENEREDEICITGEELDLLSDDELDRRVLRIKVFSRVTPEQKLRIVKSLKRNGKIVAMTGDGVNDAPSLKLADVGVAMGIMGTDVAKEAGDIVLLDDNFATIVEAIKEGRTIFSNIQKFVYYLLGANVFEVIFIVFAMMFVELTLLSSTRATSSELLIPLLPIQILWINLLTDGLPAIALGMDPPSDDVMKPKVKRKILSDEVLWQLALLALVVTIPALVMLYIFVNSPEPLVRTIVFTYIVLAELMVAFMIRTRDLFIKDLHKNRLLIITVVLSVLMQLLVIYTPLNAMLKTVPILPLHWYFILAGVLFVMIVIETTKLFLRDKIKLFY